MPDQYLNIQEMLLIIFLNYFHTFSASFFGRIQSMNYVPLKVASAAE